MNSKKLLQYTINIKMNKTDLYDKKNCLIQKKLNFIQSNIKIINNKSIIEKKFNQIMNTSHKQ